MKCVGEAMGIGRTFTEAFLKAHALARDRRTSGRRDEGMHPWFAAELERVDDALARLRSLDDLVADDWLAPEAAGLVRRATSRPLCGATEAEVARGAARAGASGRPSGGSTPARPRSRRRRTTSTRPGARPTRRPAGRPAGRVVILGSGPNRIGQGIEFDYCCVHAAQTFRELGYEAVMVNCNPETVSTDYDTSDRLYFEPLGLEEVLAICEREQPAGVVIQFGGQTPLKLARALEDAGFPILGTPFDAVDLAEDRERFAALCDELGVAVPAVGDGRAADEAVEVAERDRLPGARAALVRPRRAADARLLRRGRRSRRERRAEGAVLVDRFLESAVEIDVDALCDGDETYVAAVMQHVEEAGVHSGDSSLRAARLRR